MCVCVCVCSSDNTHSLYCCGVIAGRFPAARVAESFSLDEFRPADHFDHARARVSSPVGPAAAAAAVLPGGGFGGSIYWAARPIPKQDACHGTILIYIYIYIYIYICVCVCVCVCVYVYV